MTTSALMNNYGERTLTLVKGQGSRLWDDAGNSYLDGISGIAVCGLGHCHPAITEAIASQAATLVHTSNLYNIPAQEQLADKLIQITGMDNAFFCNSGTEANEAAIKLARKWGNEKGIQCPTIVVMEHSFHGRTMGALSATGNAKVQAGFAPLVEGFLRVPYDDVAAVEALSGNNQIVAVLVEPVQGEGGVHVPAPDYLNNLRSLCDKNGWLLMLDEIQTGNGRTGKFFAYQHNGILPDVLTTAKGLGNGFPIGATLARGAAAKVLQPGNHGTTFGGNPLASAVALAVINTLESEGCITLAAHRGKELVDRLKAALGELPQVADIRGLGMMVGVELTSPCAELVGKARAQGLLLNVTAGNTLRLLPTLNINDDDFTELCDGVIQLVREFSPA
ncbi:aspartate aminotransferase family protein [Simiduia sp. 21SJ11W-1]|uniref:aspartate aminotransferase family protein n=1 Tax=Simiduia sp. 21SJ11W-1 TaxID=2909669 RepID=UPI00209C96CF|nr:aspartate aminotransferase family protein [Simiduia sp. 21SJ11W-1]UTA49126.1 aspartate aminotransferase family protein [Simiduia sp. 21SJ11W-1]